MGLGGVRRNVDKPPPVYREEDAEREVWKTKAPASPKYGNAPAAGYHHKD